MKLSFLINRVLKNRHDRKHMSSNIYSRRTKHRVEKKKKTEHAVVFTSAAKIKSNLCNKKSKLLTSNYLTCIVKLEFWLAGYW